MGLLELDNSSNVSPATDGPRVVHVDPGSDFKGRKNSVRWRVDQISPIDPIPEATQAGELFSVAGRGRKPPPVKFLILRIDILTFMLIDMFIEW